MQATDAVAGEEAHLGQAALGQPVRDERVVDGVKEVVKRVEQRAVEVEDRGLVGHPHHSHCVRWQNRYP